MAKTIITTDFPTPEEVAAFYRIPPERVAELDAMIDDIRKRMKKAAKKKTGPRAKKK